ncbi:unnamed protein product [Rotaria sp. Silwood2]|nr:unnamed protein product [Rotaria sp. Silwood2]CAF2700463.1 unnamed protein product [Rotaria sp. Silwood2]CAF2969748.1 unnamed protein product [Rotaria sp. Silwood2]CAF3094685.1 unnamed protein product [Rotaria sp. Silwood2]CAF3915643.1 unnamed protein product [Rotaria sp. Silwood2]
MSNDQYYQHHPRTIIPVTVNPNDDQRFIRFRSSNTPSNDIPDRMSVRMRDFEEECRRWRENFFNESRFDSSGFPSSSLAQTRPRMRLDFPDFPEFGSIDWPTFRGSAPGFSSTAASGATHRSFIEEDNDGRKKYKIQFEIGEFRPEELNVKVEGRMLIVKGDRQMKVGNATESKQFNRELTLPEFIDVKTLQSYLSDDGILTMEAPVILDRVYNNTGSSTLTSSNPNRLVDTTFTSGRQPLSNYGIGNNQTGSYSSTSSTSSFRQDGSGLREANSFNRNSPLRDPYSSTSSASTLIGGNTNQPSNTFSTLTSRQNYSTNDGLKNVTYKFDLNQFVPEDIAIQVNDTMLKVTAVKQERDGHSSTHREFRREIGLPDGAEPKSLTNTLSADGILTIQIPVRDYRPPLTPTYQSQHHNLPTNINTNDSYSFGDQQLKLTFDLNGYKPDDVNVKVNDNVLKVQASHVDNTAGNQINREYMREYVLPDWVDVDNLRAKMSEDSTLTIEAPIPHDRVSALNRQIKITQ